MYNVIYIYNKTIYTFSHKEIIHKDKKNITDTKDLEIFRL